MPQAVRVVIPPDMASIRRCRRANGHPLGGLCHLSITFANVTARGAAPLSNDRDAAAPWPYGSTCFTALRYKGETSFSPLLKLPAAANTATTREGISLPVESCLSIEVSPTSDPRDHVTLYFCIVPPRQQRRRHATSASAPILHPSSGGDHGTVVGSAGVSVVALVDDWRECDATMCVHTVELGPRLTAELRWCVVRTNMGVGHGSPSMEATCSVELSDATPTSPRSPVKIVDTPAPAATVTEVGQWMSSDPSPVQAPRSPPHEDRLQREDSVAAARRSSSTAPVPRIANFERLASNVSSSYCWLADAAELHYTATAEVAAPSAKSFTSGTPAAEDSRSRPASDADRSTPPAADHHHRQQRRSSSAVSSIESLIDSTPERSQPPPIADSSDAGPPTAAAPGNTGSCGNVRRTARGRSKVAQQQSTARKAILARPEAAAPKRDLCRRGANTTPATSTAAAPGINISGGLSRRGSCPTTPRCGVPTPRGISVQRQAAVAPAPNFPVPLGGKSWWQQVPLSIGRCSQNPADSRGWNELRADAATQEASAKALLEEELNVALPLHHHQTHARLPAVGGESTPWCPNGPLDATCHRHFSEIERVIKAETEYLCHGASPCRETSRSPQCAARIDCTRRAASVDGATPPAATPAQPRSLMARSVSQRCEERARLPSASDTRQPNTVQRASSADRSRSSPAIPWYGSSPHANFLAGLFKAAAASMAADC